MTPVTPAPVTAPAPGPQSSWKTTMLGLVALLASLGSIWAPAKYQTQIQATAIAAAGMGGVFAKDSSAQ